MTGPALPRVLCVDDEANVLSALRRNLHGVFDVTTAQSGRQGLEALRSAGPFAVIVSDMRMPEMNGAAFLAAARQAAPDSVRMLLTGYSEVDAAIAVVNEGQIFRFLKKPCPREELIPAISSAVDQHRLIIAEKVLLEQTLRGAVRTLTDLLALVNPQAFGRANRANEHVTALVESLGLEDAWQIEIAAMLSQIGCVTLPAETAERVYHGRVLSDEELAMVERLPEIAASLVENIPRLEEVCEIIRNQDRRFESHTEDNPIPEGATLLKVILDYDVLESHGDDPPTCISELQTRPGWYDPSVLKAFAEIQDAADVKTDVREVIVSKLQPGMVLAEDLMAGNVLLMARGQEITPGVVERLRNWGSRMTERRSVRVVLPKDAEARGIPLSA